MKYMLERRPPVPSPVLTLACSPEVLLTFCERHKGQVDQGQGWGRGSRVQTLHTKPAKEQGTTLCFLCSLSTVYTPWGCCGPVLLLCNSLPEHYQREEFFLRLSILLLTAAEST